MQNNLNKVNQDEVSSVYLYNMYEFLSLKIFLIRILKRRFQ